MMELHVETDSTQLVCTAVRGSEVMGYVVVDSTVLGRSTGGLRMLPDIDEAEMRGLARAMTLKTGFLGLPRGGAKAGLRCDPESPTEERLKLLAEFGRAVAPLIQSRIYAPGTDMGTNTEDIRHLFRAAGMTIKKRELVDVDSGLTTALSVFTGAERACRHLGMGLSGRTAAIEGFGKVGRPLGALLSGAGIKVVAVSTSAGAIYNPRGLDMALIDRLAGERSSRLVEFYQDAERIDSATLLELPVDLLCPCARHHSIQAGNASRVRTRVVCPGANNPVTPEAERILFDRGVLCLPDFVTNCGGVLGGAMQFASIGQNRIAKFIDLHIGGRIAAILNEASSMHALPRDVATPVAISHFETVKYRAEHPSLSGRIMAAGLELYRRGWVPSFLMAELSMPYFKKSLASIILNDSEREEND